MDRHRIRYYDKGITEWEFADGKLNASIHRRRAPKHVNRGEDNLGRADGRIGGAVLGARREHTLVR